MTSHLTIPGSLEWDSPEVERLTIATLRYAGGSEHDVRYVSEVHYNAALAVIERFEKYGCTSCDGSGHLHSIDGEYHGHCTSCLAYEHSALQQRLTVAEQRSGKLEAALTNVRETLGREYWDQYAGLDETRDILDAALKPAAEPEHICKGCGSKGWTANCAQCVPY